MEKKENPKNDEAELQVVSIQSGSLIIEDNTIYEIDEDCINCLNKEKEIK